ncbi:MAG TPA: HAMP domain-containing protein, partial [Thermoanaerobaculia bacterium]
MKRSRKRVVVVWLASLAAIVAVDQIERILSNFHLRFPPLGFVSFVAWVTFCALALYLLTVAVRFVLRNLFWRVGRRLALSYFLLGVLPFVFFAVLVGVSGYLMAAVLSQASFRNERQNTIEKLDQWNLEYALTNTRPASALPTLEIYDSANGSTAKLPEWLRGSSFIGLTSRTGQAVFVSGRRFETAGKGRTIVFVQPMDQHWTRELEQRTGMMTSPSRARATGEKPQTGTVHIGPATEEPVNFELDEKAIGPFFERAWARRGIIWGDLIPSIIDWETGDPRENEGYFVLFSNPWSNLLDFYFGSSKYVKFIVGLIGGVASMLAVVYFLAALLAGGLIFSISRAINRIDKGTKAVERGDFSYRINMKRANQLGEVATSFDTMTQSIGSLLSRVAEQERLQSEISIAASIQRNLLPKQGPTHAGISFSAHFEPTASIGGDY